MPSDQTYIYTVKVNYHKNIAGWNLTYITLQRKVCLELLYNEHRFNAGSSVLATVTAVTNSRTLL